MVYAVLYRFGGTLEVISENKRKAVSAIMEEYKTIYEKWNDEKPTPEEIKCAKDCIETTEFKLDKVRSFL